MLITDACLLDVYILLANLFLTAIDKDKREMTLRLGNSVASNATGVSAKLMRRQSRTASSRPSSVPKQLPVDPSPPVPAPTPIPPPRPESPVSVVEVAQAMTQQAMPEIAPSPPLPTLPASKPVKSVSKPKLNAKNIKAIKAAKLKVQVPNSKITFSD